MKWLIWLLLVLTAAVGLALLISANDGYVLLVQPPYRIELSLNLLIVLLVIGFLSLHGLLRLIGYMLHLPGHVRDYKQAQRRKEAHAALLEGLHALAEGRYGKSEKAAARALQLGEDAGLSALVAARSAHKLKLPEKRDFYLAEAERLAPEAALSRLLMQAELLLDEHQYAQALRVLQQLERIEPRHPPALRLEMKLHQRLGNWEQLLAVLALLEKRDMLPPTQLQALRRQAHQQLMRRLSEDAAGLAAYWKKLPEAEKLETGLARAAALAFIQAGDGQTAAQIVEMSLTHAWDSPLAALYGECAAGDVRKQLQQAEYWLQSHRDDPGLLMALGLLCLREELWGKAQSYLEASLALAPGAEAHLVLARLLERSGDQEAASAHYRLSLQHAMAARE